MDHRLTHLGLLVRLFDEVRLVDDIHQGTRFDDTPEHAIDTQTKLPFALAGIAVQEEIGLAEIGVGAVRVSGVVSEKGRNGEASPLVILDVGGCLRGKAARMGALAGMRGVLRVQPGFGGETPGKLDPIGEPGLGGCPGREHRDKHPQRRRETDAKARGFHALSTSGARGECVIENGVPRGSGHRGPDESGTMCAAGGRETPASARDGQRGPHFARDGPARLRVAAGRCEATRPFPTDRCSHGLLPPSGPIEMLVHRPVRGQRGFQANERAGGRRGPCHPARARRGPRIPRR